jgi:hypothetical protein
MNTVSHPLPPLCINLDKPKSKHHPLAQNKACPKKFLKNFEKTRDEKNPRQLPGGA